MKDSIEINILIDEELKMRLDEIAESCNRTIAQFIKIYLKWIVVKYPQQINDGPKVYVTEDELIDILNYL